MSSHLSTVAIPCDAFSCASTWVFEISSSYNADEWGPLVTAASISSGGQLRPTETRHPTRVYRSNKFASGCCLALHIENTIPRNFPSMTPPVPVNPSNNFRQSSSNAVSDLFSHQCCGTLSQFGVGCTACKFYSGWCQFDIARPTRVLNLVL